MWRRSSTRQIPWLGAFRQPPLSSKPTRSRRQADLAEITAAKDGAIRALKVCVRTEPSQNPSLLSVAVLRSFEFSISGSY